MVEFFLPPELWLIIFRHATVTRFTASLSSTTYIPFLSISESIVIDEALQTKYVIIRVCRLWRDLAIDLLYEDVVVLREYATGLRGALEDHAATDIGHRSRVRRVCLPYSSTVPQMATAYPTDVLGILKDCPSLEVLVRPNLIYGSRGEAQLFEYQAEECPPLNSLKRVDWSHRNDAARTGGINSLADVLLAAPNVTFLSIEGQVGLNLMRPNSTVVLNALTTLHFRHVNMLFTLLITKWQLPSLRHIILDGCTDIYMLQSIAQSFGHQIQTLELGKSLKFYANDALHPVLESCPVLEEISYYVCFTKVPDSLPKPHRSLHTVRLHSAINLLLLVDEDMYWSHVDAHFHTFCSTTSYPTLSRVVLYGSWSPILDHLQNLPGMQKLKKRGCIVEVFH
ncbi:hypothetical protein EUX98_g8473 [Antrodiella citrinella]|uniref:F-box domain-containing protein n=1 Tax=Antrodiella citrinella TaxID=2447956 RepID=A0A4S4M6R6_9APHY|nr:hypothetical protein EUX98_g8473 [Antrodiella citrinella]